jgi:predicted site-specific integrase-resolvase
MTTAEHYEPLLTPQLLAQLLRVAPLTLQRWRRDGKGPRFVVLPRGRIRYSIADVEAFVRTNRPGRPSPFVEVQSGEATCK